MALQAKDLMVGDWVGVPALDRAVRVKAVFSTMICPNPHDDDVHPVIGDEYLQPILLTPEILEKNGWVYDGVQLWQNEDAIALEIGCDGRNRYWWHMFDSPITPINYVHELQHILTIMNIRETIEP